MLAKPQRLDDTAPSWTAWTRAHNDLDRSVPRPVRIVLPCAGIEAPGRACLELAFPFTPVLMMDVQSCLRPVLQVSTGLWLIYSEFCLFLKNKAVPGFGSL